MEINTEEEKTIIINKENNIENDDKTLIIKKPENLEQTLIKANPNVNHTKTKTESEGSIIKGRYQLIKTLGSGGMGIVYRALDLLKKEAGDKKPNIAIKVLSKEFSQHPKAFIALQRECSKTQSLAHPNIVTVYHFDRDNDIIFMTMEELHGEPLNKVIKKNPKGLPIKTAKNIILQIAKALEYAHSKSIVHSDLKPSNIFLLPDQTIKILDFGIARAASSGSTEDSDLEDTSKETEKTLFDAGELGGLTPSYASLEMFSGEEAHPADDLFALGLIACELISGLHPYHRKPANIAYRENISPLKIKPLKRHERKAIADLLELKKENRLQNTSQFIKKFQGISKEIKWLSTSLVASIIISATYFVIQPDKTGPDIALEELPLETQQQVKESLLNAKEAIAFGDINGALFLFNSAYELHPKNPQAVAGLNSITEKVLSNIDFDANEPELKNFQRQLAALLQYSALSDNKKLLKTKTDIDNRLSN